MYYFFAFFLMSRLTIDRVRRSANYLKCKEKQAYPVLKPTHKISDHHVIQNDRM